MPVFDTKRARSIRGHNLTTDQLADHFRSMARTAGLRLTKLSDRPASPSRDTFDDDPIVDDIDSAQIDPMDAETEVAQTEVAHAEAQAPSGAADDREDTAQEGPAEEERRVPTQFFHQLLHELRTIELEKLHMDSGTALSIGASGRWYFDWFESSVGRPDVHIGVEAFEPMPDDLPPYVQWNTSTADRFEGVDDNSVDLIFAGQTTEHLWAVELADFLLESHRVLRPGAVAVLDSPNRLVTEHLMWSHGGHTVELSADEICELLTLAGFTVETKTGILPTRIDGEVDQQLESGMDNGAVVARRVQSGPELLDDSFIWWVVARKADVVPDRHKLVAASERLFWQHWPTRVGRGMWEGPTPGTVVVPAGAEGVIATTLPFIFAAGDWVMGICVDGDSSALDDGFELRIVDGGGNPIHVLTADQAEASEARLTWRFNQPELAFTYMIQIVANGPSRDLHLGMPFDLHAESGIGVRAVG